jgi:tRNA G10  N-methylase Trm11
MAKRKAPEPEQRTALIIKKNEFKSEIEALLQQGNDLLRQEIKTEAELDKSESAFYHWAEIVDECLKASFNKPFNEYRNDLRVQENLLDLTM